MNFVIHHQDCPKASGLSEQWPKMQDTTRLPMNTEREFRVFRCPSCGLEISVTPIGANL